VKTQAEDAGPETVSGSFSSDEPAKSASDSNQISLSCDLVVDCMGMETASVRWLKNLGVNVKTIDVKSGIAYASVHGVCRIPISPKEKSIYYQQLPPHQPRGCLVLPVENNELVFSCIGINSLKMPGNVDELLEWTADMPLVHKYAKETDWTTPVRSFKKRGNEYRCYEESNIRGFIAMGDSVCNFNPAYGQGQTTAAESAVILDFMLRHGDFSSPSFCQDFQRRLAKSLTVAWLLAVISDCRFSGTTGGSSALRLMLPVLDVGLNRIFYAGSKFSDLWEIFLELMHMREGSMEKLTKWEFVRGLLFA